MKFHILPLKSQPPPSSGCNEVYLTIDNWNDYSFVTSFAVHAFDEYGTGHSLSPVRIGFVGQTKEISTYATLGDTFDRLGEGYFSLGMSVEYYKALFAEFSEEWQREFLTCMRDVVWDDDLLEAIKSERVFEVSHLRSISISQIRDQFASVLKGDVLLTDFEFGFCLPPSEKFAGFDLPFEVRASSTPSTNMHALIGRNGVGKTTLLNSMVKAVADHVETEAYFYTDTIGGAVKNNRYFNSLVSVAFSAFDPFDLPGEGDETLYTYIGLTEYADAGGALIKSKDQMFKEFVDGLAFCLEDGRRRNRWVQAIETLQSDENFADMKLLSLADLRGEELKERALFLIGKMSSGHAVVILTMTLLVAKVEEKTLVLFDEPESHLHPPLLSALMRSLSQLLRTRNAVAIIATHSPVVLQEIPGSCVWKVFRSKLASEKKRPDTETFGENVGVLTRDVFRLEVSRSGFHTVLSELVGQGGTYDGIMEKLGGSLGNEARGILKAMIINRDEKPKEE
ncbi:AAA domain, putative AbiEii toxin, type IV TA system [Rhodobiaceae bacterium]|nr:AAA domain, putative AbiEii toxin, type IV TA system [Rhodobiaceae bacterium]